MKQNQKEVVKYRKEAGGVAVIQLSRPEKLNAFNRDMYRQFNEAVADFNKDPDCRVAIITGSGRAFTAGVDTKDLKKAMDERPGIDIQELAPEFSVEMEDVEFTEKPIIAAINGLCYGEGLSLAISCDLRIATTDSQFCMPEVKIGLASIHGTLRMVHNLGLGNALEMLIMGDPVDADWAMRTGLINRVVAAEDLMPAAMKWAKSIATLDPHAIKGTRKVAVSCQFLDFNDAVDLGLRLREGTNFTSG
jgi:E-phenylitaconyl-CoA hydratase